MQANLEKTIKKYEKYITPGYDLYISQSKEIYESSKGDIFKMIFFAFKFGFCQGIKCQKAIVKKNRKVA